MFLMLRRQTVSRITPALFLAWMATCSAPAESPSDQAWRGQWLGPQALPQMSLAGASWIWADEVGVDPTRNAPGGARTFRREIEWNGSSPVACAVAAFAADDRFKLVVNGKLCGGGTDWRRATVVDITTALRSGINQIEVQAVNDRASGPVNAAGLIGKLQIVCADGSRHEVVTDAQWEGAGDMSPNVWKPVRVLGGLGMQPWLGVDTSPVSEQRNLWTCYRKSFSLAGKPASALARIAVDSKYWLWVNGQMVVREGGLKRGPNPSDTYFDVVELGPWLAEGSNTIAVLAWYWGKEGFAHKSSGKAGFLFELEAGTNRILSDASWKVLRHPAFGEAGNTPNFRLPESSVHFDARLDLPGWNSPGFDDGAWNAASVFGVPPAAPWNRLWPREIPQWKDYGLKDYENAAALPSVSTGAAITARLPYNAQVTPWLKVSGPSGQFLKVGTDNTANEINAEYVTRDGVQEFETPAWMNGHSVVYQIPAGMQILGLKYRESGYDTEFSGHFTCDREFYNKLWSKAQRTLYVTMRDNFMDCPDRERAAWWGDIVVELGEVFYSLSPSSHALIRKCMYNLVHWQRPTQTLFSPIPAGNWDKELPQQMLASVGKYGFWTYYLNTGDAQTLTNVYPHVKDYLSVWQTDSEGLIVHRSGENGWDWADWGENIDTRVLDNAWFCLALDGAARMADVVGTAAEAAAYRRQRDAIVDAVNQRFWNGSAYRDPGYGGITDDRANGLAVVAGIAGTDKYPAIKTILAGTRNASPYMEKYVLESLFLMDDPAAALARMQLRYQEMVDSPLTTLWELFGTGGTLNHAWSGGPLTLMSQYVAGIAPTSPGFATYHVKPQMGPLQQAGAVVPTVRGNIRAGIVRGAGQFTLTLTSPAGTKATVGLPVRGAVRINGQPADAVPGAAYKGRIGGYECYEVNPGQWVFSAGEH